MARRLRQKPAALSPDALRLLFRRTVLLAVPGVLTSVACDTYDELRVQKQVTEVFTVEELDEICGDVDWSDCHQICDEAISRGHQQGSLCDVGESCDVLECEVIAADEPGLKPIIEGLCGCSYSAGRRTAGVHASGDSAHLTDPLARWLAELAFEEATAVHAFARLAVELEHHGAPVALVEGCRRAAREEVDHVSRAACLAATRGVRPVAPRLDPLEIRELDAIAEENAAEGCVRETFAALVATWQASAAEHEALREAMGHIAHDETGHAALSHQIDAWLRPRLDDVARARVEQARAEALDQLEMMGADYPPALRRAIGFPPPEVLARLAAVVRELPDTGLEELPA